MFADDAASADGGKADLAARPLLAEPVARRAPEVGQIMPTPIGGRLSQHQGGARRRVALQAVMGLDDFNVPVGSRKTPGGLGDQADQHIDAEREISGFDDGDALGGALDLGVLFAREAGRPDDKGRTPGLGTHPRQLNRGIRLSEVDNDITGAEIRLIGPVKAGGRDDILALVKDFGDGAAHAPARARQADVYEPRHARALRCSSTGRSRRCSWTV